MKPCGKILDKMVYLVLDYVPGGIFFDTCKTAGAMGESAGRFFLAHLADALDYLHNDK